MPSVASKCKNVDLECLVCYRKLTWLNYVSGSWIRCDMSYCIYIPSTLTVSRFMSVVFISQCMTWVSFIYIFFGNLQTFSSCFCAMHWRVSEFCRMQLCFVPYYWLVVISQQKWLKNDWIYWEAELKTGLRGCQLYCHWMSKYIRKQGKTTIGLHYVQYIVGS